MSKNKEQRLTWAQLAPHQREQVRKNFGPGTNVGYSLKELQRPGMRYVWQDGRFSPLDPYALSGTFNVKAGMRNKK